MIYLEDGFPEHPKTVQAGGDAAWLFVCGLGWLRRNQSTTGLIPKAVVPQLSDRKAPARLADRLVEVGYWHDEGGAFLCHEYVERYAKAIQTSAARRQAAKQRWSKDANADANASPLHEQTGSNGHVTHARPSTSHIPHPTKALPSSPGSHQSGEAAGWGRHEAKGPNETPDTRDRRRGLALRWQSVLRERGVEASPHACNEVVAKALHVADWKVVDEQIGWFLEATVAPRSPAVLEVAVSKRAYR